MANRKKFLKSFFLFPPFFSTAVIYLQDSVPGEGHGRDTHAICIPFSEKNSLWRPPRPTVETFEQTDGKKCWINTGLEKE